MKQEGAILITAIIFSVIITLLAMSIFQQSILEAKMAEHFVATLDSLQQPSSVDHAAQHL